jgi:hypothetical protein
LLRLLLSLRRNRRREHDCESGCETQDCHSTTLTRFPATRTAAGVSAEPLRLDTVPRVRPEWWANRDPPAAPLQTPRLRSICCFRNNRVKYAAFQSRIAHVATVKLSQMRQAAIACQAGKPRVR